MQGQEADVTIVGRNCSDLCWCLFDAKMAIEEMSGLLLGLAKGKKRGFAYSVSAVALLVG